jgi:hypothetical protein
VGLNVRLQEAKETSIVAFSVKKTLNIENISKIGKPDWLMVPKEPTKSVDTFIGTLEKSLETVVLRVKILSG